MAHRTFPIDAEVIQRLQHSVGAADPAQALPDQTRFANGFLNPFKSRSRESAISSSIVRR
jgi:hypothetical protein